MKVVKSTVYAASVLREVGANATYWLERSEEVGVEQAMREMREHYSKITDAEHIISLQNYKDEVTKALSDLNEPYAASTTDTPSVG